MLYIFRSLIHTNSSTLYQNFQNNKLAACLKINCLIKGSYMSGHGLMNLLNEFGKSDKMRGLPSILSLF